VTGRATGPAAARDMGRSRVMAAAKSPLWMLTQEPLLNGFVTRLTETLHALRADPGGDHELVFARAELRDVRHAFSGMILRGEERLHRLSELLCRRFFPAHAISSVVFGEVDATRERFVLTQSVSPEDLYSTADIDLGTRQLAKLRFLQDDSWSTASLVANVVEYQPTEPNRLHIHKLVSRIKAEQEIWNKVCDEIFGLDGLVRVDKQMSHLGRFVKDVFGLKFVVGLPDDVWPLHRTLMDLSFDPAELAAVGLESRPDTAGFDVLEVKDYVSETRRKESGWLAMKSVVRWSDKTFEIQIQPLRNYFSEQEYLTRESHAGFKARREKVREEIAKRIPLFGFYQALLKWLFVGDACADGAPHYPGVRVRLTE
jgi:hypothetical protein